MSRSTPTRWLLALAAAAVLALAGCGDDDGSGGDAAGGDEQRATIEVVTDGFAFDPDDITVDAGSAEIVLDNTDGPIEHDFTVDELDVKVHADAGETAREVVDLEAGSYTFYCSIPGHREAGMEGTLTVN